jgi:hypothetical protein
MSRIPAHTIEDAPEASRALLQNVVQFSPTGRPLNVHAQMAHSPAVIVAYRSQRAATAEHGTLGPQLSADARHRERGRQRLLRRDHQPTRGHDGLDR